MYINNNILNRLFDYRDKKKFYLIKNIRFLIFFIINQLQEVRHSCILSNIKYFTTWSMQFIAYFREGKSNIL